MNLQTERIDNHRAQFTIELESEQLEEAKRQAARRISRRVRIKGFRQGKAPYRLVVQNVGEGVVLEEAIEALGDGLYKRALEQSQVAPYGPGAFEEFKLEPAPTLVFSVPLQPEVSLNEYREIRLDFEPPTVSEAQVESSLRGLRAREVKVLDDEVEVAALGNRVTIAIDSEFIDGEPPEEDSPAEAPLDDGLTESDDEAEAEPESTPEYAPRLGDTFVKDENSILILDPNDDPFVHGFVEKLVGVERGADVVFDLTIPDDDAEAGVAGRQVEFTVTMKRIEAVEVPELDDQFARQLSRGCGDEETDLAGLRETIRDELERSALDEATNAYSGGVLQAIVDQAEIHYPDLMVEEQIDEMLREFEGNLAQRRLSLDEYLRLSGGSKEDLREGHRERATALVRQSLVMRELATALKIEVATEEIDARVDGIVAGYGGSVEIRQLFDTEQMRSNFRGELLMGRLNACLAALGKGEDAAAALDELRARTEKEAERASERSERAQRYREEDEAAADGDAETRVDAAPANEA